VPYVVKNINEQCGKLNKGVRHSVMSDTKLNPKL